jgi:hypothetical protein
VIQQAEDRGIGPDAQRQRRDGDEREHGLLPQGAKGKADILHGRLDGPGLGRVSLVPEKQALLYITGRASWDACFSLAMTPRSPAP